MQRPTRSTPPRIVPYVGARRQRVLRTPPIAGFIRKLGKRPAVAPFSSILILDPRE